MKAPFHLADAEGGADVFAVHEDLPPGVSPADNETGWPMALAKLKTLVKSGEVRARFTKEVNSRSITEFGHS